MKPPDWFTIIRRWRDRQMGQYGVGLPFLVGAIVAKKQSRQPQPDDADRIVRDMIENPVEGFVIEVTWCENIKIPVFRATPFDSEERVTYRTVDISGQKTARTSLVFDRDLANKWGRDPERIIKALLADAQAHIVARTYSRHGHEWGDFSQEENQFIEEEIMGSTSRKSDDPRL